MNFYKHSIKVINSLEESYNLLCCNITPIQDESIYKVDHAQKVIRGEKSLKRSISDVLNTVIPNFKYTNLDELNAILGLYNVKTEPTLARTNRGLIYFALKDQGKRDGPAFNASDFLLKPTLNNLEKRFILNESLREDGRKSIKQGIDWTLFGTPPDWAGFQKSLRRESVNVVLQIDPQTSEQNIYFVDFRTKTAMAGLELGSNYTLTAIRAKCLPDQEQTLTESQTQRLRLRL